MKKILLFLFLPFTVLSQNTNLYFEESFGTAGIDVSRSVKQLSSGSIFIVGNSTTGNIGNNDISLTKLDKFGNTQWTEYYGTQNPENGFYLNTTADGNLVFVGESQASFNDLDVLIYKVDTSGNIIWNKVYATPVNESPSYIEQTTDGGYVFTGFQNDTFGFNNALVVKLDAAGNYQWGKSIGGADNDIGDMIHQINNNKYILTGDSKSWSHGNYDVEVYELDSAGNVNWQNNYGDTLTNGCKGILVTSDNNYISYGEGQIYPNSPFDFIIQKINAAGTLVWRHIYGGLFADAAFSGLETTDGGFVFTGYSNSYNGGAPIDLVVFKIDSSGTFLWKHTYGSAGIDIGYEIIKSTVCSGYVVAGYTTDSVNSTNNYYVLQLTDSATISNSVSEYSLSDNFNFSLSPNPASSFVSINYCITSFYQKAKVVFYDVVGNEVQQTPLFTKNETTKISTEGLSFGYYFCSLFVDDKRMATKKVIIGH